VVFNLGQPPQLMEDKGDLLIYLYLFFCLLPFKIQNENGSIKSFSVIISFFLNFDPPIQCIPIQYQTNNIRRNYTWERAMKIDF
ncbi:unnamed protein product, partial [Rotaria magnacalcarata]